MMFYIGSDLELPLLRSREGGISISVEPLHNHENVVRQNFDYANVYYVGSHEGCGCGFLFDPDVERDEDLFVFKSLGQLADYIELQFERRTRIQLFAVWDGDQDKGVDVKRKISVSGIRSGAHFLEPEEVLEIRDLLEIEVGA